MCAICGVGVPVCNLAGGCGVQMLDFIKIAGMTGGAGLGIALTTVRANLKEKKDKQIKKSNEESKK